ncbi:hypothetical protein QL285_094342 [Trifolium repens]|nr:hypothetical protein QL285_094342 [Trifolium repens]
MEEKTTLELGLETIVDGVVKDGVWDVYSILTLEGISEVDLVKDDIKIIDIWHPYAHGCQWIRKEHECYEREEEPYMLDQGYGYLVYFPQDQGGGELAIASSSVYGVMVSNFVDVPLCM